MTDAHDQVSNSLENLPGPLLYSILLRSSTVDKIRAEAACKALRRLQKVYDIDVASEWLTFRANKRSYTPLCPQNVGKLKITMADSHASSDVAKVYAELQSWIDGTRQSGVMHLNSVHELAIHHDMITSYELRFTAQHCMRQLLQLVPNLRTLWIGSLCASRHLLGPNGPQPLLNLRRLSLDLAPHTNNQLARLPTLAPNLDTLCFTFHGGCMDASWLQPLSQLSHLQYLSMDWTVQVDNPVPEFHHVKSLRHLKLSRAILEQSNILGSMTSLQQLDSLILCNVRVDRFGILAPLATLNVSSLTLQHVYPGGDQRTAPQHRTSKPLWPNLARVVLQNKVSELILQAMLLPHPAVSGLKVETKRGTFDNFDKVYKQSMLPNEQCRWNDSTSKYKDYSADTTPLLGPEYFAAAGITALKLEGQYALQSLYQMQKVNVPLQELRINTTPECHDVDCMIFPALRKLTLHLKLRFSSDSWYTLFSKCPLLKDILFWAEPQPQDKENMEAAADKLGIRIEKQKSYQDVHYRLVCCLESQKLAAMSVTDDR